MLRALARNVYFLAQNWQFQNCDDYLDIVIDPLNQENETLEPGNERTTFIAFQNIKNYQNRPNIKKVIAFLLSAEKMDFFSEI